ncbi:MAG: DNA polymerase III subunit chi [Pseudomonadota bacterium]
MAEAGSGRGEASDEPREFLFYHLKNSSTENVLSTLLEKTIERGWKADVAAADADRLAALDVFLWTYRDDGFLPHGVAGGAHDGMQPVLLTCEEGQSNGGTVLFLIDGVTYEDYAPYSRVVYLFQDGDRPGVEAARALWRSLAETDWAVSYWAQEAGGGFAKKA